MGIVAMAHGTLAIPKLLACCIFDKPPSSLGPYSMEFRSLLPSRLQSRYQKLKIRGFEHRTSERYLEICVQNFFANCAKFCLFDQISIGARSFGAVWTNVGGVFVSTDLAGRVTDTSVGPDSSPNHPHTLSQRLTPTYMCDFIAISDQTFSSEQSGARLH